MGPVGIYKPTEQDEIWFKALDKMKKERGESYRRMQFAINQQSTISLYRPVSHETSVITGKLEAKDEVK